MLKFLLIILLLATYPTVRYLALKNAEKGTNVPKNQVSFTPTDHRPFVFVQLVELLALLLIIFVWKDGGLDKIICIIIFSLFNIIVFIVTIYIKSWKIILYNDYFSMKTLFRKTKQYKYSDIQINYNKHFKLVLYYNHKRLIKISDYIQNKHLLVRRILKSRENS